MFLPLLWENIKVKVVIGNFIRAHEGNGTGLQFFLTPIEIFHDLVVELIMVSSQSGQTNPFIYTSL